MNVKLGWIRRRMLALGIAALCVVAISSTALAGHQDSGVKSYTGCLVSGDGVLIKIKEGNTPKSACSGGQVEAHFSGGDITKISVGNGLTSTPNPDENGEVRIELAAGQTLPSGCVAGRVAEWNGSAWVCGVDNDTTYAAGTGLELDASETPDEFSIRPAYRLPGKSCTAAGEFVRGFDSSGVVQCAAPPAPTGLQGFSATVGFVALAGEVVVISKTLPPGSYLLFASVELKNQDNDNIAQGNCAMPGYATERSSLDDLEAESLSLSSAIVHPGGAVTLRCKELFGNVDVTSATLNAIKVDSIG